MSYLVIENQGEMDLEALRLMGASTKRSGNFIGMFGTGAKYAIAVLMSKGIGVTVTSGVKKAGFETEKAHIKGQGFDEVVLVVGGKKKRLGFTTEMGLQWDVDGALRELVSNAYDEQGAKVERRTGIEAKKGFTRVWVEYTEEVKKFDLKFDSLFLFNRKPLYVGKGVRVYEKEEEGAGVYRKGVRVFYSSALKSLYDWDFDELEVREDRTSEQWTVQNKVNSSLDVLPVRTMLNCIKKSANKEQWLEAHSYCSYQLQYSEKLKEEIKGKLVITPQIYNAMQEELNGVEYVLVGESYATTLQAMGALELKDILSVEKIEGIQIVELSENEEWERKFNRAVRELRELGYWLEQDSIGMKVEFFKYTKGEEKVLGEYVEGKNLIRLNVSLMDKGLIELEEIMLHEWAHKMSKMDDKTRGFESWMCKEILRQGRKGL